MDVSRNPLNVAGGHKEECMRNPAFPVGAGRVCLHGNDIYDNETGPDAGSSNAACSRKVSDSMSEVCRSSAN